MERKADRPEVTLLIRFSALGDVAMTLPVVYGICESYPERRFVYLTSRLPSQLFVNAPANLEVRGVDLKEYKGLRGLSRLTGELMENYRITVVGDLHNVIRSRVISSLLRLRGAVVRHLNKGRHARRALTRRNNKVLVRLKPMTERYLDLFSSLGLTSSKAFHPFRFSAEEIAEVCRVAGIPPKGDGQWLAIAPFARHEGKIYPPRQMREVVSTLSRRNDLRLLIFGAGEKERGEIDSWITPDMQGRVVNMATLSLGLRREMALLSVCDLMLSMDSANMHLASLTGLRTISIWGATHPFAGFLGWRQQLGDTLQLTLPCRPCSVFGDKPCLTGDYRCMRSITPAVVVKTVEEALKQEKGKN